MNIPLRAVLLAVLTSGLGLTAKAELIRGDLLNDDDPYFVRAGEAVYKVEWYGGSSLFSEGDEVILTTSYGFGKMISDVNDETADVWVEQVETPALSWPEHSFSPAQTPYSTPRSTAPSYPTPSPQTTATPSTMPTANLKDAQWPDGRKLLHPDQFVTTRVVNVSTNDTLKLRSGPGTSFRVLGEIPADETNITAFNFDQVWDGDTWWCPVEWRGLRGYVGRSHLPKP
jgi:hypothetical protein